MNKKIIIKKAKILLLWYFLWDLALIWDNTRAGTPAGQGNCSLHGSVTWRDEALDDSPESLFQSKRPACRVQFTIWHIFPYLKENRLAYKIVLHRILIAALISRYCLKSSLITRTSFRKAVSGKLDGRIYYEDRVTHYRKPKLCHAEAMFSTLLHFLRYFIKLSVYLEISKSKSSIFQCHANGI